ncbi:Short transient receptor putative channel 1 [Dermatophagoides pteronyssinus]|uniref:Short transient receptor putative channel 1 n=1 Tax=Dermatophagoides pteronyssinus TaxID=6956 RepID=A0ABQ8JQN6_DERPT|nr:Short transient receptor putative channel 1 [Dermatophagoides pteronyssinus]
MDHNNQSQHCDGENNLQTSIDEDSIKEMIPNVSSNRLTIMEKKFLLAVERGDLPAVKRIICHMNSSDKLFNINCRDPLGRSGLLMAIDNENIEMIKLLLMAGVEMKDALLHAINEDFVEAVELLLDHEDQIHEPGQPNSWEAFERETFTNDITPLVLAAHRNNYEIVKIILDRNISPIPIPHGARCGCKQCRLASKQDCLQHSRSRINAFKALSSPSLIALNSKDPILTAFDLSWQLRRLSFLEPEFKQEYLQLRKQCQLFATALLDHTRTSEELEILLDYDPDRDPLEDHERLQLSRLKLAIQIKQKMFCAHASVQQLLASIWYEGLPGFRRKNIVIQITQLIGIGILFPFLSIAYILAPYSTAGKFIKKPFIKFICHSASYVTFLILLMLASQRIESNIFGINPIENINITTKRGSLPSYIELCILAWVFGLIWSEIKQLWDLGISEYLSDMWNILDFINNSIYVATIALRIIAYYQTQKEIIEGLPSFQYQRENWDDFDPILLSEGLFATANIFSSLKLVYIFSVNPYLGPLQISLGRMVIDILKFFSIYLLVLFSFACGMNQLLWYYADMEKQSCFIQQDKTNALNESQLMINEILHPNACLAWRRFANLFESTQTLFWATFGLIDLDNFELTGIKSYTRFWGLLMFGVYSIINVAVLLNLLIAMMNHSYQLISEQADTEWKFARSKLWISYFGDGATVPPPFNIIPTPKTILNAIVWLAKLCLGKTKRGKNEALRTIKRKQRRAYERDYKYHKVVRALIRRYIMNEQRIQERQRGVTEDDCNEIKQEVSALRYDLMEMLGSNNRRSKNGVDTMYNNGINSNCHMGKKSRQRERRLMKGFNFDHPIIENNDNNNQDIMTSFDINEEFEDKSSTNISDSQKTSIHSPTSVIKNKFYRTAQNLVQNKKTNLKWRQMIELKREKTKTFSRSQDSIESDATLNTDGSYGNNNNPTTTSIDNRLMIDANIKRQIFAGKLDSMSLSQPILQQQQQQNKIDNQTKMTDSFSNETIKSQCNSKITTTDEDSHWL